MWEPSLLDTDHVLACEVYKMIMLSPREDRKEKEQGWNQAE